jgi:hypothetical protein
VPCFTASLVGEAISNMDLHPFGWNSLHSGMLVPKYNISCFSSTLEECWRSQKSDMNCLLIEINVKGFALCFVSLVSFCELILL